MLLYCVSRYITIVKLKILHRIFTLISRASDFLPRRKKNIYLYLCFMYRICCYLDGIVVTSPLLLSRGSNVTLNRGENTEQSRRLSMSRIYTHDQQVMLYRAFLFTTVEPRITIIRYRNNFIVFTLFQNLLSPCRKQ